MKLRFWKSYKLIEVEGSSMDPALKAGWYILFREKSINKLCRKDIILFEYNGQWVIKRIIGLPNEFIQILDNALLVNDALLEEDYLNVKRRSDSISQWQLGSNEYVILGDNSDDSLDSRKFGNISLSQNVFVYKRRFWPLRAK